MTNLKDIHPRKEHTGWNLFVHMGMIVKVLTAIALLVSLWFIK